MGNVAQLAVDLLVATLKMEHIGHLYDECFLPLVCHSAFDHTKGAMSTSAEGVYVHLSVCMFHHTPTSVHDE